MCFHARLIGFVCAAAVPAVIWSAAASAQPSRPITFVNAYAPGSIGDFVGRAIASDLATTLGQPVIVENRSGGGGAIASASVAKAPPDGTTLIMTTIGPTVLRPLIDANLPYDAVADFTPIGLIGEVPNVLATNPKLNFANVQDVVTYAKRNPGRVSIAHAGPGTVAHLLGLLFAAQAGIEGNFVSYRGAAPMVLDLAAGQVDFAFPAYGPEARVTKILAVASNERIDFLPGVPTMKESNFPGVVGSTWYAVYAPAGVPSDVVARLNGAINAFLDREEVRKKLAALGFRILGGSPERLRQQMIDDRAKWSEVITSAKITINPQP
jgi:tripartite-type tricarboxylate transporter receptor subunit TctC